MRSGSRSVSQCRMGQRQSATLDGHEGAISDLTAATCSWEGSVVGGALETLLIALSMGPLTLRAGADRWRATSRRCWYDTAAGTLTVQLALEAAPSN